MSAIYFFDLNKYIIDGLNRGYFEFSALHYFNIGITLAVFLLFYTEVGLICANTNQVNLVFHRSPFGNIRLFSRKTLTLLLLCGFSILATNDIFTFASYSQKFLIYFKYFAFYLLIAFFTLFLCIYFSGRMSVTYTLREGTRCLFQNLASTLFAVVIYSVVTFASIFIGGKLSGQSILILGNFKIIGFIKALMTTSSVGLGVSLFKKSDFLKFSVTCM